jgi:hypothetical protein
VSSSKFSRKFIIRPAEHMLDLQYASANANPQATAWPSMNTQAYRRSIQKRPGYTVDRAMVAGDPVQDCMVYTKNDGKSYSLILTEHNLLRREPATTANPNATFSYLTDTYTGSVIVDLISNGAFTLDASDWAATDCTLASTDGGVSGHCLHLTMTGGSLQYAAQTVAGLTIGQQYVFTAYVKNGTAGAVAGQLSIDDGTTTEVYHAHFTTSSSWVKYSLAFTPTTYTSFSFRLMKDNATAGTMLFDSVTLSVRAVATLAGGDDLSFTDTDLTAADIQPGDKFIFDSDHTTDQEPDTNWAEVLSVTDGTNLILTAAYTGSATSGTYKIRKVYSTPTGERWTWTIVADKFIFTNGDTNVQYWDGTLDYADDLNSASASRARYCLNYADRLFLADLYFSDDGGVTSIRHPWTVRCSANLKPETYLADGDTTSADYDFLGTADVITGLGQVGPNIVVYKYDTIIIGNRTGVSTSPIQFGDERRGLGCIAPYSIIHVSGTNVFLGGDNFYSLNGTIPEPFGDKVRDKFFDIVGASDTKRVWGRLLPNQHKILWVINTTSGEGQLTIVYDFVNKGWATWKFYSDVTGIGECA